MLLNPGAITFPLLTDTVALIAASQTLTNKILTSPTINGTYSMGGTMTIAQALLADADATRAIGSATTGWQRAYLRGTGGVIRYDDTTIMGVTRKTGTGNGTPYTTTSGSFVDIDGTNLAATVTIPLGWKALVTLSLEAQQTGGFNYVAIAISDGGVVLAQAKIAQISAGNPSVGTIQTVVVGDAASHTFKAQFLSPTGTYTATVTNAASNYTPVLTIFLLPSN